MQEGPFRNLYADCAVSIRDRVRNRRSHAPFRQVHGICRFFRVFPERPCDMVCRPFFLPDSSSGMTAATHRSLGFSSGVSSHTLNVSGILAVESAAVMKMRYFPELRQWAGMLYAIMSAMAASLRES